MFKFPWPSARRTIPGGNQEWEVDPGGVDGAFTTIQAAIDAILDASASKPYAVFIHSGIYDENVVNKSYVSLVGIGKDPVIIRPVTDPIGAAGHGLTLQNITGTMTIANISIETGSNVATDYALRILDTVGDPTGRIEFHHCHIAAPNGGSGYLISNATNKTALFFDLNGTDPSGGTSTGMKISSGQTELYNGNIAARNFGVDQDGGTVAIRGVFFTVSTADSSTAYRKTAGNLYAPGAMLYCDASGTGSTGIDISGGATGIEHLRGAGTSYGIRERSGATVDLIESHAEATAAGGIALSIEEGVVFGCVRGIVINEAAATGVSINGGITGATARFLDSLTAATPAGQNAIITAGTCVIAIDKLVTVDGNRVWGGTLTLVTFTPSVWMVGSADFVGVASVAVALPAATPMPSDQYQVHIELPANRTWWITNKAVGSFTIQLSAALTGTVPWSVVY